ncbi:MAG: hypothetical protein HY707_07350 [Ignavibacteriae bacterium]|nr:hypothetical protein [Ignavibacteriota bacterium]
MPHLKSIEKNVLVDTLGHDKGDGGSRTKRVFHLKNRLAALPSVFLTVYVPTIALLCGVVLLRVFANVPIGELMRDPVNLLKFPFYLGLVSNIGILFWCSAAAICLFTSVVMRKHPVEHRFSQFLFVSGIITIFLLLDDFFNLHDVVYPEYLHIHEYLVYAIYGTVVALYLVTFRATILQTENALIFLLALGFFGLSLLTDMLTDRNLVLIPAQFLVEDGLKLFGIMSWFAFFSKESARHLKLVMISR